ncbi:hypothetical protein N7471_008769 [Penicillium samsonianum]|uniref:uncharacterized protein n=1 Tax=Penicillium samsonianum TaxID=1882272 RepID=UPI002548309E|nr:uncharacterized protein N7471_008769 [Penicillium samsonianum]KAJ6133554.1 hypothetical protein N7471_008769 [Penicillium samsonianum]
MSQPPTSPLKKAANFVLRLGKRARGGDGADDDNDEDLAPAAKRSATMQSKGTSTRRSPLPVTPSRNTPAPERDPGADLPKLTATPRNVGMWVGKFSANMNPDKITILDPTPERETIDQFQRTGAQFQAWMAKTNPDGPACPVSQSTLTIDDLIEPNHPDPKSMFIVWKSELVASPVEIRESLKSTALPSDPKSKKYRYTSIQRNRKMRDVSNYEHCIVEGAIVAKSIYRNNGGPYWGDVALALYKQDAEIDTLRYVFATTVENDETLPLVGKVLYRNNNLPGPGNRASTPTIHTWQMDTPEFQQILGTQLGRAVARLVLSAWRKGTHQIPRIHTWFLRGNLHMRFDIEPRVPAGARPPPSGTPPPPRTSRSSRRAGAT